MLSSVLLPKGGSCSSGRRGGDAGDEEDEEDEEPADAECCHQFLQLGAAQLGLLSLRRPFSASGPSSPSTTSMVT